MKPWKSVLWVLSLSALLLGVPRGAGAIASLFDYRAVDPDGAFAWISVHHLVQALVFLLLMAGLRRSRPRGFGLGWGDRAAGRRYLRLFVPLFGLYTAVTYTVVVLSGSFQPFGYPLTATNILGQLGFQLLLSGPSEELIFRAFAITMLAPVVTGRILGNRVSAANTIAAVVFGLAHMRFSLVPPEVHYHLPQVFYAMGLGLLYGDCYEKTGSVYYPMIMHSFTNVAMVGAGILLSFVL